MEKCRATARDFLITSILCFRRYLEKAFRFLEKKQSTKIYVLLQVSVVVASLGLALSIGEGVSLEVNSKVSLCLYLHHGVSRSQDLKP